MCWRAQSRTFLTVPPFSGAFDLLVLLRIVLFYSTGITSLAIGWIFAEFQENGHICSAPIYESYIILRMSQLGPISTEIFTDGKECMGLLLSNLSDTVYSNGARIFCVVTIQSSVNEENWFRERYRMGSNNVQTEKGDWRTLDLLCCGFLRYCAKNLRKKY